MRTLVVGHDIMEGVISKLRCILRAQVDTQGPTTATFDNLDQALFQIQPDMVVVALSPNVERGLEILRKLRREIPGCLLAVGPASEPKIILRALHGGADHYLDESDLETGVQAVLARL